MTELRMVEHDTGATWIYEMGEHSSALGFRGGVKYDRTKLRDSEGRLIYWRRDGT